jgi:hypothetical protein
LRHTIDHELHVHHAARFADRLDQRRGATGDLALVRDWAARLCHGERLERILEQARSLDSI